MVGIAIISHGALCEGIVDSAHMIAGDIPQSKTVSLRPGMQPDDYREQVRQALTELDTGDGVLVLADIPGGTPYNSVALLMREFENIALVTGLNLPMLVTTVLERDEDTALKELVETAVMAGTEGIKVLQPGKGKGHSQNGSDTEEGDEEL